MKQLTKEQHEAICEWLVKTAGCTLAKRFEKDFEPSCCDSCADGDTCEIETTLNKADLDKAFERHSKIIEQAFASPPMIEPRNVVQHYPVNE